MNFSSKRNGHKVHAYPIDDQGRISSVSKGPVPKGSPSLNKNKTSFKVTIPNAKPETEQQVVPPAKPEPSVHSLTSALGSQTHDHEGKAG